MAPNFHPDEPGYVAHALAACHDADVRRVVYHSVASPYVPAMAHHVGKARAEDLVRRSGLAWTILQPGVYVQNFDLTRPVPVPYDVHARFGFLDLADLGEAAATVLTEDGHEGATYELASRQCSVAELARRGGHRRGAGRRDRRARGAAGDVRLLRRARPPSGHPAAEGAAGTVLGWARADRHHRRDPRDRRRHRAPAGRRRPRPGAGYAWTTDAAEATAHAVRERGHEVHLVAADITTDDGVDLLFARAAELGTVTGLVNNAGATIHIGPLIETPVDVVRRTVDLNLTAAILCARAAVRLMATSRGGSGGVVVNVSSGAATLGAAGEYVQYAAAKAGVDALTTGLAIEVAGEGIRVVGVAPGIIETTIHADAGEPGRVERVGPLVPLGRAGEPAEVADAIGWLMSDEASYVTGTTLRVAGGR